MHVLQLLRRRRLRAIVLTLFGAMAALSLAGAGPFEAPGAPPSSPAGRPRVLTLEMNGAITAATAEHLQAGLALARDQRFDLVLITMDTPGGTLDATEEIVKAMLASDVPVVVWVGPAGARAASAGTFITLAANVAAMDPASHIGAAHPVTSGGGDVKKEAGEDMAKKLENDTAAFIRNIAEARHRNAAWAEKAVRESVSITATEAVKDHVVDLTAPSVPALLTAIDGRTVKTASGEQVIHSRDAILEPLPMTIRQRTLAVLSDPNIVALLMLIGLAGIALEFYHPGSIFPGAAGALCLFLALLGSRIIPVSIGGVLLIVIGVGLLVTEAYITTHGVAGVAGAVCIAIGTLLFIDKSSPEYQFAPGAFSISPLVVWPTPIVLSILLAFVAYKVVSSRRGKLVAGEQGLVGELGEALSDVGPQGGEVFVHGEYWRARAGTPIPRGARVRVTAVDGLVVTVVAKGADPAVQG